MSDPLSDRRPADCTTTTSFTPKGPSAFFQDSFDRGLIPAAYGRSLARCESVRLPTPETLDQQDVHRLTPLEV